MPDKAQELIQALHQHFVEVSANKAAYARAHNQEELEIAALEATIFELAKIYQQQDSNGYRPRIQQAKQLKRQLFNSVESHLEVCAALYNYLSQNESRYLRLHPTESETFRTNLRLLKAYTEVARACYVTFHINLITGGLACASTTSLGFLIGSIVGTFGLTMATTSALLLAATGIGAPVGLLVGIGMVLLINYLRASNEAELKIIKKQIDGSKQLDPAEASVVDENYGDNSDNEEAIPLVIPAEPSPIALQQSPSATAPHAFLFSFAPNLEVLAHSRTQQVEPVPARIEASFKGG